MEKRSGWTASNSICGETASYDPGLCCIDGVLGRHRCAMDIAPRPTREITSKGYPADEKGRTNIAAGASGGGSAPPRGLEDGDIATWSWRSGRFGGVVSDLCRIAGVLCALGCIKMASRRLGKCASVSQMRKMRDMKRGRFALTAGLLKTLRCSGSAPTPPPGVPYRIRCRICRHADRVAFR